MARTQRTAVSQSQTDILHIRFAEIYRNLDSELAQRLIENKEALEHLLLGKIDLDWLLREVGFRVAVGPATPSTSDLEKACYFNYIDKRFRECFSWNMPSVSEGVNAGNVVVFEPVPLGRPGAYRAESPEDLVQRMYEVARERTGRGDSDLSPVSLRESYLFCSSFPTFCGKRRLFIPWVHTKDRQEKSSVCPMFGHRAGSSAEPVTVCWARDNSLLEEAWVLSKREDR